MHHAERFPVGVVCDGSMQMIGLTGGIGAGKSAVATRLAALGALVIDSDKLAREVVEPGTEGLAEVVAHFGPDILKADGTLDRPALGRRVFGDDQARKALESIIHPRVRARSAELISAAPAGTTVVQDIPLLIETGMAPAFDQVIVVLADEATRLRRLTETRGMSADEAKARIAAQATDDQRRRAATILIANDSTLEALTTRVDEVWRQLQS